MANQERKQPASNHDKIGKNDRTCFLLPLDFDGSLPDLLAFMLPFRFFGRGDDAGSRGGNASSSQTSAYGQQHGPHMLAQQPGLFTKLADQTNLGRSGDIPSVEMSSGAQSALDAKLLLGPPRAIEGSAKRRDD